jgi:hypothetical protein
LPTLLNEISTLRWANGRLPTVFWMSLTWFGYFCIRDSVESFLIDDPSRPERPILYAIQNANLCLALVTIAVCSVRFPQHGALTMISLMVAVCALGNLAAGKWLYGNLSQEFGESRFTSVDTRWAPPIVRSNGVFAMIASVTTCACIYGLWNRKALSLPKLSVSALLFSGITCSVASIRCQFRAHVLTLVACLVWCAVTRSSKRFLAIGASAAFLLTPIVMGTSDGQAILQGIGVDSLLVRLGSKDDGAESLSGRVYMWQYGIDRVLGGYLGPFGDGPRMRDSSPSVASIQETPYRIAFHSGALDLVISHGLLGTLLLSAIAFVIFSFSKASSDLATEAIATWVTLWNVMGTFDGGWNANFETNLIFCAPVIAWALTLKIRARRDPPSGSSFTGIGNMSGMQSTLS